MKPFKELTYLGQVRRLRRLAQSALDLYGLGDAQLEFMAHGENTTFRVTAPNAPPAPLAFYVFTFYSPRIAPLPPTHP